MFTGLIQAIGTITQTRERNQGIEYTISAPDLADAAEPFILGESIACDGCCLTVETASATEFTVFASPETLRLTSLGSWQQGRGVNLERAMKIGDRLGGHLVSGHVDAKGSFREATNNGDSWEVWINAPAKILDQSIPKGSITVDGISLTLVDLSDEAFSLWIIPETWERTTLSRKTAGDPINLESDMIGKYIRKSLAPYIAQGSEEKFNEILKKFSS